jgi:hypothetical protein
MRPAMIKSGLLQEIGRKETDKEEIAGEIIKDPGLLSEVFAGLSSDEARVKYGCVKVLRIISEKRPQILYPGFDFLTNLLDSANTFLRWGTIHILANLATVDSENRFERVFDRYFAPIPGPVLITAANVVGGAARIALARPELTARITNELLKVDEAKYQTTECRNIALGHAIKSFDRFFNQIEDKEPVILLIRKQLQNTRNGTRKKAEKFIKKYQIRPL